MPHMHQETWFCTCEGRNGSGRIGAEGFVSSIGRGQEQQEPFVTVGWIWKNGPHAWSCCVTRPHDTMHYTVGKFTADPEKKARFQASNRKFCL